MDGDKHKRRHLSIFIIVNNNIILSIFSRSSMSSNSNGWIILITFLISSTLWVKTNISRYITIFDYDKGQS